MTVITRDKKWEWKNSFWLLWVLTLFFGFISFLWIGPRAKQMKWTLSGFAYLLIGFGSFLVATDEGLQQILSETVMNFLTWVWFITGIVCLIHALVIRKDYLNRRWEIISAQQFVENNAARENFEVPASSIQQPMITPPSHAVPQSNQPQPEVRFCAKTGNPLQGEHSSASTSQVKAQAQQQFKKKIDLNNAPEQELTTLPGVSVVLAKRAVTLRESNGKFTSTQDFCKRLGIMPHFAVQIEKLSTVSSSTMPPTPSPGTGRVVDI